MADDSIGALPAAEEALQNLIWERPLYTPLDVHEGDDFSHLLLYLIQYGALTFDAHCVHCGKDSTFKREGSKVDFAVYRETGTSQNFGRAKDPSVEAWRKDVVLSCQRVASHAYVFIFLLQDGKVQKFGQYPSMEDISGADIKRFRAVLEDQYFSDLRRAGGLASHGVGIGSFVYLRRIFEKLIFDHHKQYVSTHGEIADFDKLRMMEKVTALSSVLPEALIEYRQVYAILSKGVHELDEPTCRKYFPAVKAIIIAILEQDLQNKAKADAAARLRTEMGKIIGELSN